MGRALTMRARTTMRKKKKRRRRPVRSLRTRQAKNPIRLSTG
jgi:hypothetical protein